MATDHGFPGAGDVRQAVLGEGAATPLPGAMPGALAGCIGVDAVALTPAEAGAAWLARTPEAIRHVALMEELVGIKQMLAALCHRMGVAT